MGRDGARHQRTRESKRHDAKPQPDDGDKAAVPHRPLDELPPHLLGQSMELFEGTQRGEVLGELGSAAHVVQIAAGVERKAREEGREMPRNGAVLVITDRPARPNRPVRDSPVRHSPGRGGDGLCGREPAAGAVPIELWVSFCFFALLAPAATANGAGLKAKNKSRPDEEIVSPTVDPATDARIELQIVLDQIGKSGTEIV